MRFRVSIAVGVLALALPAYAQHGARGGFSSHSGMSSHAGFAGHPGFSGPSAFSRPAPSLGSGLVRPGSGRFAPPARSGLRIPYRRQGYAQSRPPYRSGFGDGRYGWNRGRYRPWVVYSYGYEYGFPGYLGYPYPYVIDPGFYDWGDSGGSDNGQALAPDYQDAPPNADYGVEQGAPQEPAYGRLLPAPAPMARQPYAGSVSSAPEVEQPLTVIFKNGRVPETMQNYMMNSSILINLDRQHYEQIPLDQIDMAATEQTNRSRGVNFQVPSASRE